MDRSEQITLIKSEYVEDAYGVQQKTETRNTVFCDVASVTASEFFQGGQNGLKPDLRFTMFRYDYNDETVCEYNGKRYSIYRTYYGRNDLIELYVQRKKGDD